MTTGTPEFPRTWIAAEADFGDWATAERCYRELAERALQSRTDVEQWLLQWSELDAALDEERTSRHIAVTRRTDDAEREKRHLHFLEQIEPKRAPWRQKLQEKLVEAAGRFDLPAMRYEVLLRDARNAVELFREENIPLFTEDDKLKLRYDKITSVMTVEFRGREHTISQLRPYLEDNDRSLREQAWRAGAERFFKDKDELSKLYQQMVALRHRVARNAGFGDYRAYSFRAKRRFDYTPQDCLDFHKAIETAVVPAVTELAQRRRAKLGIETVRPWDLDVDPDGRPPLRPFHNVEDFTAGCSAIFHKVHRDFGAIFDTLAAQKMLDLDNRRAKAPGGYQETYDEQRMPFIFMNAVGTADDVQTLLHEGGHAFHTWACRNDPLLDYRRYPIEFAEVASMGMECLALPHLERFFGDEAERARQRHLADVLSLLPWIARVDAMQHHVYTHVDAGMENWLDHWQTLTRRFAPHQDWSGLEPFNRYSWQRKLHFYQVPFYYIEYAIAQLGALQVWLNSRKNYNGAVANYQAALTLGGSRPLPELFETAGCKFDFTERTLAPLVEAVMAELG